jgi:hypothetical protein
VCDTVGALPEKQEVVQSGVTAFKQRMLLLLLLFFQWCMRIYFPWNPPPEIYILFGTEKIVVEGRRRRRRRWVDGYK